jgi:hypothetical protein
MPFLKINLNTIHEISILYFVHETSKAKLRIADTGHQVHHGTEIAHISFIVHVIVSAKYEHQKII